MPDELFNLSFSLISATGTTLPVADSGAESVQLVSPNGQAIPAAAVDCSVEVRDGGVRDHSHAGTLPTAIPGISNVVFSCGDETTEDLPSPDQSFMLPVLPIGGVGSAVQLSNNSAVVDYGTAITAEDLVSKIRKVDSKESHQSKSDSSFGDKVGDDSSSGFGSGSDLFSRTSSGASHMQDADCSDFELRPIVDNETVMLGCVKDVLEIDIQTVPQPLSAHRKLLSGKRRLLSTGSVQQGQISIAECRNTPLADDLNVLRNYVPTCLENYGFCVFDGFLGPTRGRAVAAEVKALHEQGVFLDGLLTNKAYSSVAIRGDRVYWLENENSDDYANVCVLLRYCDHMMQEVCTQLKPYNITSRSKAMMACYPGEGRGYMKHVDNPNQDGRCVTCIYYLNEGWCSEKDGGLLRLAPMSLGNKTVDIEPQLDRLLFFWSDHRTPHEVLPAFRHRYAITIWYFDEQQRLQAKGKAQSASKVLQIAKVADDKPDDKGSTDSTSSSISK